jgi:LacI family transcriptional regulator
LAEYHSTSLPDKPTVVDVARTAQVAVGTVSRVLNTPELVSPEIRQRVLEVIERINYIPLRRRKGRAAADRVRRRNIGVLFLGMEESFARLPVFSEALQGVEKAIAAANGNLLLANIPDADHVPVFIARNLVDGLIVRAPLIGDFRRYAHRSVVHAIERLPHVWLVAQPDSAMGDVVESDHDVAGRKAAEYLLSQGHRFAGYFRPHPSRKRILEPRELLTMFGRNLGLSVRYFSAPQNTSVKWPVPSIDRPAPLLPLLDEWERIPRNARPTVLAVGSDEHAVHLYSALQQRGYQVGRDVSIFSFRRETTLSASLTPALATLDIQATAIGRRAVDHLLWSIEHRSDDRATKIRIEPRLIPGPSVANIA